MYVLFTYKNGDDQMENESTQVKHGIGADLIFSCYIYATEELCHKGTLYKSCADRHCQILFARKFQAANTACFGDPIVFPQPPKRAWVSFQEKGTLSA